MVTRRIIPDAYTEYEDGHLGVVPASLANVEAKIGKATGGTPFKVYTLAGPDAKNMAKTIFISGPLLKAIEEAFDAGSTRIYATRIGTPDEASLTITGIDDEGDDPTDLLMLRGVYGEFANSNFVNVSHSVVVKETGHIIALQTAPLTVGFFDEDFVLDHAIQMPDDAASLVGVWLQEFPKSVATGESGFWALGTNGDGERLWHYDENRNFIEADTIDLSAFIPGGDTILDIVEGPMFPGGRDFAIATDLRIIDVRTEEGEPVEDGTRVYADLTTSPTLVGAAAIQVDFAAMLSGEDDEENEIMLLLDVTDNKIFGIRIAHGDGESDEELGSVDISGEVQLDTACAISYDLETGDVLVGVNVAGLADRVIRCTIDWDIPSVTFGDEEAVTETILGMAPFLASVDCTTSIKIQDRHAEPEVERIYSATGEFTTVTSLVADAVNAGGVYVAELLVNDAPILMPSMDDSEEGGGGPDGSYFVPFADGADGGELSNDLFKYVFQSNHTLNIAILIYDKAHAPLILSKVDQLRSQCRAFRDEIGFSGQSFQRFRCEVI